MVLDPKARGGSVLSLSQGVQDPAVARALRQIEGVLRELLEKVPTGPAPADYVLYGDGSFGTPPSGSGGALTDGDYGDITVSGSGTVMSLDAGTVSTTELGGDITVAGKALLDDADAAAQRTTLGLGTVATHPATDFANASHTHAEADVTNLVTDLAAKVPTTRTVSTTAPITGGGDLSANRTLALDQTAALGNNARVAVSKNSGATVGTRRRVNLIEGANVTLTVADDAANEEVDVTIAAASGSDPWTYVKLGSDFNTTSATAVNVTGLAFTPSANLTYVIEGYLLLRTATTTVGPRPGATFPTGLNDSAIHIEAAASNTTQILNEGNANTTNLALVTGEANTTGSWPALIAGMLITGASPSGAFQVQLASETAGTTVTIRAGSWIRYRTI